MKVLFIYLLLSLPLIFAITMWCGKRAKENKYNFFDYILSCVAIILAVGVVSTSWNVFNYKAYRLLYSGETVYVTKSGEPKLYHDDEYCDEIELQSWEDRIVEIPIEIAEELGYTRCDICP